MPSSYEISIAPSSPKEIGTSYTGHPGYRSARGNTLTEIIERVSGVDRTRIEVSPDIDNRARYDFELHFPIQDNQEKVDGMLQRAIAEHFQLTIGFETRSVDAYVVTAPHPETLAAKRSVDSEAGMLSTSSSLSVGIETPINQTQTLDEPGPLPEALEEAFNTGRGKLSTARGISVYESTIEQFCRALEPGLDRPVVNETHLQGIYDFEVRDAKDTNDFLLKLRDQLGLVLTPGRRDITMLVIRRR